MTTRTDLADGWMFIHKWVTASDERRVTVQTIHEALLITMQEERGGQLYSKRKAVTQIELREAPQTLLRAAQQCARELMEALG